MTPPTEEAKEQLQFARAAAEQEKLVLETQRLRRENAWPARAAETLKSLVVVVGGIITLGIGYNLTDLKNEKLKQEVAHNEAVLKRLAGERRTLEKQNAEYRAAIASAALQVRQITGLTEDAAQRLDALQPPASGAVRRAARPGTVGAEVQQLRQRFAAIDQRAGDASVDLQATKSARPQAAPAGGPPLAAQVTELFAPTAGRRGRAYQALTAYYAADPNLVPALLQRAAAEPANLNGLYNALVVLGHLSPLPPGTDVGAVRRFALASRGKGPRIAGRAEVVLRRLPKAG